MNKKSFLIVDDETFARKQISEILQKIDESCNIIEVASLSEAKESILQIKFSIIFLDINLKGESGFDLVPFIHKKTKVVFITAMNKYAIRAFEVNAMDYILKPPTLDRVKQTIELLKEDPVENLSNKSFTMADRIFIQENNAVHFINIKDINYICAKDVYTQLYTSESKAMLVRKPLKEWIPLLPENDFIQIHRSTIINLNVIDRMKLHTKGTYIVYLQGIDTPFSVSRTYATDIKKRMII